jgi:hypothetical protein
VPLVHRLQPSLSQHQRAHHQLSGLLLGRQAQSHPLIIAIVRTFIRRMDAVSLHNRQTTKQHNQTIQFKRLKLLPLRAPFCPPQFSSVWTGMQLFWKRTLLWMTQSFLIRPTAPPNKRLPGASLLASFLLLPYSSVSSCLFLSFRLVLLLCL